MPGSGQRVSVAQTSPPIGMARCSVPFSPVTWCQVAPPSEVSRRPECPNTYPCCGEMNCRVEKPQSTGKGEPVTCQLWPASSLRARRSTAKSPCWGVSRAKPTVEFTNTGSDTRSAAGTTAPLPREPSPFDPPPGVCETPRCGVGRSETRRAVAAKAPAATTRRDTMTATRRRRCRSTPATSPITAARRSRAGGGSRPRRAPGCRAAPPSSAWPPRATNRRRPPSCGPRPTRAPCRPGP